METKEYFNPELNDSFANYKELTKSKQDRKYNDFHELQADFKELRVKDKKKNNQMMTKGNRKKKKKKPKINFEGEKFKDPDPYQLAVRKTNYGKKKGKFVFEGEKFKDPDPDGLAIRKSSSSNVSDKEVRYEYMTQLHHAHPGLVHGNYLDKNAYIADMDNGEDDESSLDSQHAGCFNRSALAQFLAVGVKNVLLLGYGMTLGFPTIVIPAIQGGEGRGPSLEKDFVLNKDQISWLSSINLICVPLGCVFSGLLTQPIGRRRAMQIVNIPMLIAWLLFHLAEDVHFLYCGLALAGFSGGLAEAPVLTYVAEITQPRYRGMLAATGSTCVIIGVLLQFLMGSFLRWRTVALCSACFPVISFLLLFFIPESPAWLAGQNRHTQARKALAWLRGWVPEDQVEKEFYELQKHMQKTAEREKDYTPAKKLKLYASRPFLQPFLLISLCFFIGHFSGMTTLQTYAVQIFHTLKAPIDKYYATVLLGVSELLGTLFCVGLVHYSGKRPLVFASTIGCAICFFSVATYAYFLNSIPGPSINNVVANVSSIKTDIRVIPLNHTEMSSTLPQAHLAALVQNFATQLNGTSHNASSSGVVYDDLNFTLQYLNSSYDDILNKTGGYGEYVKTVFPRDVLVQIPNANENKYLWLPLTLLLGSAFLTHMGIRLIPWMLIGELFAPSIRSGASGIAGGTGYIFGFFANKLFLKMLAVLSLPGTFWMYSAITVIGAGLLYKYLPETEGKSLLEIEGYFVTERKASVHLDLETEMPPKPKPRHYEIMVAAPPPPLPPRSHPLKDDVGRIRKISQQFGAQSRRSSEASTTRRMSDVSNKTSDATRKMSTTSSKHSAHSSKHATSSQNSTEQYRKISASKAPLSLPPISSAVEESQKVVPQSKKISITETSGPTTPAVHEHTQRYRKLSDTRQKHPTSSVSPVPEEPILENPKHRKMFTKRTKPTAMQGFDVQHWDSNVKFEEMLRRHRQKMGYSEEDAEGEDGPQSRTTSHHDLRVEQQIQQCEAHLLALGRRRGRQNSGSLNALSSIQGYDNRAYESSVANVNETKM